MGLLTRADYAARVLLSLSNSASAHPVVAAGMHYTAINNAPNRLIRENPDMFPEHHNRSWTVGPTAVPAAGPPIVTGNRIPLPDNLLELQKVLVNALDDDPSVSPGTWASSQEQVVTLLRGEAQTLGLFSKEMTDTGYPSMCARKDSDLMYYPTTRAGYVCYFRLYGTSIEEPLEADTDTFLMHRDFDQVIVLLAASETAEAMGWTDKAEELLTAASGRMKQRGGVMARERASRPSRVTIAGMPGRGGYGW